MNSIQWSVKKFVALTLTELYDILQIRAEVFVVEQDCVYQDLDYADQNAWHLMAFKKDKLVAYARIFSPKIKYDEAAIGRVITHQSIRKNGIGKTLMNKAISFCKEHFPSENIKISAQCYLEKFYKALGFKVVSEIYLEDGIEHQEMILLANT